MTQANPAHATVTAALAKLDAWRLLNNNGVAPTHKRQLITDIVKTVITVDGTFDRDTLGGGGWVEFGTRGVELALTNFDAQLRNPDFNWGNEASRRTLIITTVDRVVNDLRDSDALLTIFGIAKASYEPTWIDANDDFIEDALQAPQALLAPAISGTAAEGNTLTVSNGTWTGPTPSYTYEWFRDGALIEGETSATYDLIETVDADPEAEPPVEAVEGDAGKTIQARVTATNDIGATSAFAPAVVVAELA
jgi:hypothetical protein